MPTARVEAFRRRVNDVYRAQELHDQPALLLPTADTEARLDEVTVAVVEELGRLEPFGNGNPQPIVKTTAVRVMNVRRMGDAAQHVKLTVTDEAAVSLDLLAFNAPDHFFVEPGAVVTVWYSPDSNAWRGAKTAEGRLLHLEPHAAEL